MSFSVPPQGYTELYTDGSQWTYRAGHGKTYVTVVGVLYDGSGVREEDKVATVNRTSRTTGYAVSEQWRPGKITCRSRYQMDRQWGPRPALSWEKNRTYELVKSDGATPLVVAAATFPEGSAVLVPADGTVAARVVSADERDYWREYEGDGS